MKKFLKIFGIILLVLLLAVQLYPKPAKNESAEISKNDIHNRYAIPANVDSILKVSCYDCHSNNTVYPWYARVQPVAWWLGDHITEGKREINFSEFLSYRVGKQYKKMAEIKEQIDENEMPLSSYTLIHTDAKLSREEKLVLVNWSETVRDSIKALYPADSLLMPRRK